MEKNRWQTRRERLFEVAAAYNRRFGGASWVSKSSAPSLSSGFEYKEIDGERVVGAANGGIWWQITVRQIGAGHVLLALIVFQDGSWVKLSLSCEPIYGPFKTLNSCFENNLSN